MRILIITRTLNEQVRKTVWDHLYSFKHYVKDVDFFYCDICLRLPFFLQWVEWDGVIIHYALLAERFDQSYWKYLLKGLKPMRKLKGAKTAIPQDEYAHIVELQELCRECGIDTVFTCALPVDYDKIYPLEETGLKHRFTTLTGFVDENTLEKIEKLSQENSQRDIDIGYRARKLPYWLGRHGQIKSEIAEKTLAHPLPCHLKVDISTDPRDVFYEDEWLKFLLRSRTTLGCLGGASLFDPDGTLCKKIQAYVKNNPQASFDEVERECFPGKDFSLNLFALSPRHFECAMTKTCQILLEGNYQGVLIPGRHYIELKSDYSNLDEVILKAADADYCRKLAEATYNDLVASGKYTYRTFAQKVVDHIRSQSLKKAQKGPLQLVKGLLWLHNRCPKLRIFCFKVWYKLRIIIAPKLFPWIGP